MKKTIQKVCILLLITTLLCSLSACKKENPAIEETVDIVASALSDGDIQITCLGSNNANILFENRSYSWTRNGQAMQANTLHATVPDDADLANLPVSIAYSGTSLRINGATVGNDGSFSGTIDFTRGVTTIRVDYGDSMSTLYYVSAAPASFDVNVSLDISNLQMFSNLSAGDSYKGRWDQECPYLDAITDDQIAYAEEAASLLGAAEVLDSVCQLTGNDTCLNALLSYGAENGIMIDDSFSDDSMTAFAVNGIDDSYGGTYTLNETAGNAGDWMCMVERGRITITLDKETASIFYLMPGDTVTWVYTCNLGYDLGVPIF